VDEVASVFGQPYRSPSGTLLIPVARTVRVYRPGAGSGPRGEQVRVITAAPRAIIEVDDDGVRIKEIVNSTLLGAAGILLVAWNVFWITRTVRAFANKC
jgi:hypothetical protein